MVKGVGVPSSQDVVMMETCGVTMLNFWGVGKPDPPPPHRGCIELIDGVLENGS
jgi:hypothetical protein